MKKIFVAGMVVMATLLNSCSSDTHEESSTYGNVEVRFSSLILKKQRILNLLFTNTVRKKVQLCSEKDFL